MVASITVGDVIVGESDQYAIFFVRLDAPATGTVTVDYTTSNGQASGFGNDYSGFSGTLTFAAGESVKMVRVPIVNDNFLEAAELFFLELSDATNANITRQYATATIIDNDAASGTPVVTVGDLVVDEASGQASFAIILNRPSTSTVSLSYATQNGSAVAGSDYVATSGSLNFAAGETVKIVTVALTNDGVAEANEAFSLVVSNLVGATTFDASATAIIGANDATAVANPNLLVDDIIVGERDGYVDFVVRLDAPATSVVTVDYTTSNGQASGFGNDYYGLAGTLTFAVGETVKTVRIPIINDTSAEASEIFFFELSDATNANITRQYATATIIDNDAASGTPAVTVGDLVVDEASGQASFAIILNRPSTSTVSLNYATQNGSAVAGSDYVATSGSLNFAAGETVKIVTVALTNDVVAEANEAFGLVVSNLVGATTLDASATAIIGANDATAVANPNLLVDDIIVGERDGYVDFVVRLDAPATSVVTVDYTTSNGQASGFGNDYYGLAGTLTFAVGETVKTVRIPIINDTSAEASEIFFFELSDASNATITRQYATATIIDNDAASGTPVVTVGDLVVDEASGQASFAIILNRPSTSTVSLSYATQNGSAVAGSDYVATSGSLNFAAGETVKIVTVALTNDAVAEANEAFGLVVSNLVGATTLDASATAIIGANDAPAAANPNLLVDDIIVGERDGYVDFVVRLDAPATSVVTVDYTTSNGQASGFGNDYYGLAGTLTFAVGETVKTVRIPIINDTSAEASEIFFFELSDASNATITRQYATATIIDNDAASGTPVVTVGDLVVDEASGQASFAIILNRPSTSTVSLSYATQNGSAVAGSDYVATSGSLNFAAGETVKIVTVALTNDAVAEASESLDLVVSNLVGATTLDASATAIIGANDATAVFAPRLSVSAAVGLENASYLEFVVALDAPATTAVTVDYTTANGDASGFGNDYYGLAGTLTFAVGETIKTVRIPIINDTSAEPTQSFFFNLSDATNATIVGASATGTIIDNDTTPAVTSATIAGSAGFDILQGTAIRDVVTGGDGNDFITTGSGNDSLAGGNGNDILEGSVGDDQIDGGAGTDTASYAGAAQGVSVNLAFTAAQATGGAGTDTLVAIESIIGSNFDDVLTGSSAANILTGLAGNDRYVVGAGDVIVEAANGGTDAVSASVSFVLADNVETLTLTGSTAINGTGNALANSLVGNAAANVLTGGLGDDTLAGGLGNDTLDGGAGIDAASYAAATAAVTVNLATTGAQATGGAGSDTLTAIEAIIGGAFNDSLTGNAGNNALTGNAGNDTLQGGLGNDMLNGGDGIDTVSYAAATAGIKVSLALTTAQVTGGAGSDTLSAIENITGSALADTLTGGTSNNIINGGNGNDVIDGGNGNDTINGGAGNNILKGGAGNDTLVGSTGADLLTGGAGKDVLTGGTGNDRFIYLLKTDGVVGANADRITDLAAGDILDLSAIDANATTAGVNDTFVQVGAFSGVAGQFTLAFAAETNTTTLLGDTDGNGVADFSVVFTGDVTALTANWVL